MPESPLEQPPPIGPDSLLWEIIFHHRATEAVFKQYEQETGHCLCCEALFQSLAQTTEQYGLDLAQMLARLRKAAGQET